MVLKLLSVLMCRKFPKIILYIGDHLPYNDDLATVGIDSNNSNCDWSREKF